MKQQKPKKNENHGSEGLVICTKPDEYKIFDIRAKKPIWFKNENDSIVMQEIDSIDFSIKSSSEKISLNYYKPNNIGILLNISYNNQVSAKELFESFNSITKLSDKYMQEILLNSKYIYDFIEQLQVSIVFGYTALEAFTNLSIPDS